jgi:hypothetical protein
MKTFPLLVLAVMISFSVSAQSASERSVMKPLDDLFLGMKKGDSALAHSAFMSHVNFVTVRMDKAGKPELRKIDLLDFLNAVGTPHAEPWNELIWDTEIRIDGNFAQVWAKFAFHLDKKLSHCGVDAFQLFKGEDGNWKIFILSDTHHTEGCKVPATVTAQLK